MSVFFSKIGVFVASFLFLYFFLPEETPFYAAQDERIVDLQGEALKILKALEAIVGHLRRFLVDHTVVPLFEKQVSLLVSIEIIPFPFFSFLNYFYLFLSSVSS